MKFSYLNFFNLQRSLNRHSTRSFSCFSNPGKIHVRGQIGEARRETRFREGRRSEGRRRRRGPEEKEGLKVKHFRL